MLTFDEPTHSYFWRGVRVPNVTGVLHDLYQQRFVGIPFETLERAKAEGKAIHAMAEYHFQGDLQVSALPAWLEGRYQGLLKFCAEKHFECKDTERRVFHPLLMYAGMLDLRGSLLHSGTRVKAFIDLKRSFYGGRVTGLQLSGYEKAYVAETGDADDYKRFALRLTDKGGYELEEFDSGDDYSIFVACLTRHRFMEGLK